MRKNGQKDVQDILILSEELRLQRLSDPSCWTAELGWGVFSWFGVWKAIL